MCNKEAEQNAERSSLNRSTDWNYFDLVPILNYINVARMYNIGSYTSTAHFSTFTAFPESSNEEFFWRFSAPYKCESLI